VFSLWVQNDRGDTYELTHQQDKFIVSEVDGLGYPVNNLNISPAVNVDGGRYNSAHLNTRNIVITVHFVGYNIETRRHELYKMLPAKSKVKVMYKCKERHVYTEGYVENIDVPIFVKHEIAQISIICPDAYWHDFSTIVGQTSYSLATFKFPEGFPEQGETISVRYDNPVCRMQNRGDAAVGFNCKLTIDAAILEEQTCTARIMQYNPNFHQIYVPFPADWYPDGDRFMRVYKNGTLMQPTEYDRYWINYAASSGRPRDLMLSLTHEARTGDTISVQTREQYQGSESREYLSGWQSCSQFMPLYHSDGFLIPKPSWYDGSSYIDIQLTGAMRFNGEINPETVHAVPDTRWSWEVITQDGNEYISVKYTDEYPAVYNEGNLQAAIYGDETVTTERIIRRQDVTVGYNNFTRYRPDIIDTFDSNIGKIRLFKTLEEAALSQLFPNGEQYTIVEVVSATETYGEGGTYPTDFVYLFTDEPIETLTREQFIMPKDGVTDIREWTDAQINTGLGAVTGVRVTNTTTGEYFEFPDLMFGYFTQPISVSTETGNLYATVNFDTDIPILYAFSGKFFKLQPGVNILEVTATGNQEYLHGEFRASQLWAGV
jgi:predicted phage tail component-like protein